MFSFHGVATAAARRASRTRCSLSARSCRSSYTLGETSQQIQQQYLKGLPRSALLAFRSPRSSPNFGSHRLHLASHLTSMVFSHEAVKQSEEPLMHFAAFTRTSRKATRVDINPKAWNRRELLVPYVFLTNGGGTTEAHRAATLSRQLSVPVNSAQVQLGHTPFKALAERYRSRRVLAVGKGDPETALISYGFSMVVKMDKYCSEFQHIDPLQSYKPWSKNEPTSKDILMPANERQIAAVFVCSDPVDWGRDLQVLCDVLRSGGFPGKSDSTLPQPPLFFAADDFEYPTSFPVPRFGLGAFRLSLERLYTQLTRRPLAFTCYGKPKQVVYRLAAEALHQVDRTRAGSREAPALQTLYMVGDNPETDIAGAGRAGRPWFSVLVRSGNFRGKGNHHEFPADQVVDDVYDAVEFILRREGVGGT